MRAVDSPHFLKGRVPTPLAEVARGHGFDYCIVWTRHEGALIISAAYNISPRMCQVRQFQAQRLTAMQSRMEKGSDERCTLDNYGTTDPVSTSAEPHTFPVAVGLPVRVADSGAYEWVTANESEQGGNTPLASHRKVAIEVGIRTVLGLAMEQGAVLEMGSPRVIPVNPRVVKELRAVWYGVLIGQQEDAMEDESFWHHQEGAGGLEGWGHQGPSCAVRAEAEAAKQRYVTPTSVLSRRTTVEFSNREYDSDQEGEEGGAGYVEALAARQDSFSVNVGKDSVHVHSSVEAFGQKCERARNMRELTKLYAAPLVALSHTHQFDYAIMWTQLKGDMVIAATYNVPVFMCNHLKGEEFSDESWVFKLGEGLPGRVTLTKTHEWVIIDQEDARRRPFKRREAARRCGIRTVLGVSVENEGGAVLEMGSKRCMDETHKGIVEDVKTYFRVLGFLQ